MSVPLDDNDRKNQAGTIAQVLLKTLSSFTAENRKLVFDTVRQKFCTDCGRERPEHRPHSCNEAELVAEMCQLLDGVLNRNKDMIELLNQYKAKWSK